MTLLDENDSECQTRFLDISLMFNIKSEQWFVAQHKPNAFSLAKKNLENQGIKTFLPMIETTRRTGSRFSGEIKPLFPGYIFVSFELGFQWTKINNTVGISRLIAVNNVPQILPREFIDSLSLRCDPKGLFSETNCLEIGKKVKILKGPFATLIGSIETLNKEDRVTILLEILGRKTNTVISKKDI